MKGSKGGYILMQTKGERVKKSENFVDVINGSPIYKIFKHI